MKKFEKDIKINIEIDLTPPKFDLESLLVDHAKIVIWSLTLGFVVCAVIALSLATP